MSIDFRKGRQALLSLITLFTRFLIRAATIQQKKKFWPRMNVNGFRGTAPLMDAEADYCSP